MRQYLSDLVELCWKLLFTLVNYDIKKDGINRRNETGGAYETQTHDLFNAIEAL